MLASFQTLGKVNKGNLFVVAKWWAGTYRLSALASASDYMKMAWSDCDGLG
jgi:hypothetical protein